METRQRNLPIVGIVVTISPNFNLYRIVVLPAASSPTMRIRTGVFDRNFHKAAPIDDEWVYLSNYLSDT